MADALREGLRLPDQRLQPLLQVGGGGLVVAMVDLAGVAQLAVLASAEVDTVSLTLVERETGDGQGLPLRAGLLHPIVAAAAHVSAVMDALKSELAGVREHLAPVK
ncbi:hypothetical protein V1280_004503 [Bradyrhizobium sp. AZCC 2230]